jgi:type II secretory pathway component PulM
MKRPETNDYQPLTARRRLLLLALGIATALVVAWLLLERPGGVHGRKQKADAPRCLGPKDSECVGGKVEVIAVPAGAVPASAVRAAP